MKITALIENRSSCELKAKHGLALYVETKKHKLLFDVGPNGKTLLENAASAGVELADVDTVVISHGHYDHGGALKKFLEVNSKARVYVQRAAFEKHYIKKCGIKINIGLDRTLLDSPRLVLVNGGVDIDEELQLFTVNSLPNRSLTRDCLLDEVGRDVFRHEQHLIINENKRVLLMGCGHKGVDVILSEAEKHAPEVCIGGFHLMHSDGDVVNHIANELKKHDLQYYTCHCTGISAYEQLAAQLDGLDYLSCGQTLDI